MARQTRDDIDRFHEYGIHVPTRTIYIGSELVSEDGDESGVDALMAERVVKNLHTLDSANQEPITIIMNNVGGFVFHGMAIYGAIVSCRSRVKIIVRGQASSMGSLILQAADDRVLDPYAIVMIHHGSDGYDSNHTKNVRKWVEFGKRYDKVLNQIYLDRIREKNKDFQMSKLDKLLDFDTILTARQAVDLGLADNILGEEAQDE